MTIQRVSGILFVHPFPGTTNEAGTTTLRGTYDETSILDLE